MDFDKLIYNNRNDNNNKCPLEVVCKWTFPLLHEILRKFKIGKKYHHSLKEHPKFSKIAKFGCEML